MKKICIDARMLNNAGIGSYLKTLLNNLKLGLLQEQIKFFLIVTSDIHEKEKWLLKDFELIFLNAPIYSIKEQILFPLKIPKCDLFFSPHFNIPIFPIRAKKRLVTIHDVYHLAFFSKLKFLEKIYAKFFISKATLQSEKIITVSNFSKSEIIKYTKTRKDKIEVIHNAIDFDLFKKDKSEEMKKKIVKKLDLPSKYFLFVGNFKQHKNLSNILLAFEELQKKYTDVYLVIVGKNKNLKNSIDIKMLLKKKAHLISKIRIINNANDLDLPIIYEKAIALVFPSFYEGFGRPPLEAMSMGCPIITSNLASLPEVCSNSAIYVDPYKYESISQAMEKVIEDLELRNTLIQKGLERIKIFSIENFVNQHLRVIKKLL